MKTNFFTLIVIVALFQSCIKEIQEDSTDLQTVISVRYNSSLSLNRPVVVCFIFSFSSIRSLLSEKRKNVDCNERSIQIINLASGLNLVATPIMLMLYLLICSQRV